MKITVKTIGGKILEFDNVTETCTIYALKEQIGEMQKVEPFRIKLILNGRLLANDETTVSLEGLDGKCLTMVVSRALIVKEKEKEKKEENEELVMPDTPRLLAIPNADHPVIEGDVAGESLVAIGHQQNQQTAAVERPNVPADYMDNYNMFVSQGYDAFLVSEILRACDNNVDLSAEFLEAFHTLLGLDESIEDPADAAIEDAIDDDNQNDDNQDDDNQDENRMDDDDQEEENESFRINHENNAFGSFLAGGAAASSSSSLGAADTEKLISSLDETDHINILELQALGFERELCITIYLQSNKNKILAANRLLDYSF